MNAKLNHQNIEKASSKKWSKKKIAVVSAVVLILGFIGLGVFKASNVLTIAGAGSDVGVYEDFEASHNPDRINVLLLGTDTGQLTDTIILFSFNKKEKKAAMISIPRDLYLEMPEYSGSERINYAHALGKQRRSNGGGMALSKEVVQYVTGVHIDHVVTVNFNGFREFIDILGGIQVYRDTDFTESQQWQGEGDPNSEFWYIAREEIEVPVPESNPVAEGSDPLATTTENAEEEAAPQTQIKVNEYWVFRVPKGTHTLNGKEALYYARSRHSSTDFDRARRQQEVLSAAKTKALSLGVISNPLKVFDIIDTLGNNVKTDMGLGDIRSMLSLVQKNSDVPMENIVLDNTNFLYDTRSSGGAYILLPNAGDFSEIREYVINIFD